MSILTVLELLAGFTCAVGLAVIVFGGSTIIAAYGTCICAATFVALFFGQRMAKDYAGAAALVPYMTFVVVSLFVLTANVAKSKIH